jgi:molybdopterin-binding protein
MNVSDKVLPEVVIRTAAGIVTSIIATGFMERMNLKRRRNFRRNEGLSVSIDKE